MLFQPAQPHSVKMDGVSRFLRQPESKNVGRKVGTACHNNYQEMINVEPLIPRHLEPKHTAVLTRNNLNAIPHTRQPTHWRQTWNNCGKGCTCEYRILFVLATPTRALSFKQRDVQQCNPSLPIKKRCCSISMPQSDDSLRKLGEDTALFFEVGIDRGADCCRQLEPDAVS